MIALAVNNLSVIKQMLQKLISPILVFLLSQTLAAQTLDTKGRNADLTYINPNCEYHLTYTSKERNSINPFSLAKEVWLVAFPFLEDNTVHLISFDPLIIDHANFRETILLSASATDTLTDILYNYAYRRNPDSLNGKPVYYVYGEKGCYMPRNAILFLNEKRKTFAFIELCFECSNFRVSSNEVVTGNFCIQKYDLLKRFFRDHTIRYGIDIK